MKLVNEVMTREVIWSTPDATLFEIAKLMVEGDCGEIPLVKSSDDLELVGVITDRDIVCRSLGIGRNPTKLSANDCMTAKVVTGDIDMTVNDCIDIMEENQIRRLPIVNANGRLCGIISLSDVVRDYSSSSTDYPFQPLA